MRTRVISGAVLTVLTIALIYFGSWLLLGVLFLLSCIAYRELVKAVGISVDKHLSAPEIAGYLGILIYYGSIVGNQLKPGGDWYQQVFMFVVIALLCMMAVYVFTFPKYRSEQIMGAFFCMIYAPVCLSFVYLLRMAEEGIFLVWMIFISSWICDTCAYFAGVTMGKHKLAPVLSPKKSIEGSIGGILGAIIVACLYSYGLVCPMLGIMEGDLVTSRTIMYGVIAGVGAIVSQVGDLGASAIKRNHEIKDYGNLIPGHGGIMDRFDSVIITAPMIFFLSGILK